MDGIQQNDGLEVANVFQPGRFTMPTVVTSQTNSRLIIIYLKFLILCPATPSTSGNTIGISSIELPGLVMHNLHYHMIPVRIPITCPAPYYNEVVAPCILAHCSGQ